MERRTRKRVLTFLGAALGGYLLLCVVARAAYPRVLFPAPRLDRAPRVDDPSAKLVELPHADGSKTAALHYPADPGARTVVVFHGNGETIFHNVDHATELKRRGLGVLLVEYRGYGTTYGSPPTEEMLYEDGEAAIAYLARERVPEERVALWGWSLGSGVAAEMARRGHGARLVLLAPFTSITDMGRRFAPVLPVSLVMKHRLDTLSKAAEIRQPTLVVHGDADELIPFAMGEAVARAIPGARLVPIAGGHHADLLYAESTGRPDARALFDLLAEHLSGR
ncbi:MAG: alpha/beta hydrolase [Labilithrix sp.]|nr:alpha/beta hydrolase [Labilithrix sp.]